MRDFLITWALAIACVVMVGGYMVGVVALCIWLFSAIGFWVVLLGGLLVVAVSCTIASALSES